MTSNRLVCSLCYAEDPEKLYFLTCLNVLCNQCIACHIRQQLLDLHKKSTSNGSYVTRKETENKDHSTFPEKTFLSDEDKSLYSFARDDEYYETITTGKIIINKYLQIGEDYEVPTDITFYQNSERPSQNVCDKHEQLINNSDEDFYEEVNSKIKNNKNEIQTNDEVFEEVLVKQNEKNPLNNRKMFPPMPSFRRKSTTLPISSNIKQCNLISENTPNEIPLEINKLQNNDTSIENESQINNEMESNISKEVHFKCPLCRELHRISEKGELLPFHPRHSGPTSEEKANKIIEHLTNLPKSCNSKLCIEPLRNEICITCGKMLCEYCSSRHHSDHHTIKMDELNLRQKDLVGSYTTFNSKQRRFWKDEAKRLESIIANLTKAKTKTIEALTKQKKLLMMELNKIFKDKINLLERNLRIEMSRLEGILGQIDAHVSKTNRFDDFSKAFFEPSGRFPDKMGIFQSIIDGHSTLSQFKIPAEAEAINVCLQQSEVNPDVLSSMIGEFYFKKQSNEIRSNQNQVEVIARSDLQNETIAVSTKPGNTKSLKGKNLNRMSRIFKRSSLPPKSETPITCNDECADRNVKYNAPNGSFNLQLTSDVNECKLTDFTMSSRNHIVALDSNNRCVKILDLVDDSLRVLNLEDEVVSQSKFVVIEDSDNFILAFAQQGSNHIKLCSTEKTISIGESYLLNVSCLAANSLKQILVSDVLHKKIFVYDYKGRFLFHFPRGLRGDKLNSHHSFTPVEIKTNPHNDDVIILDDTRRLYLIFDRVGTYLFRLPVDIIPACGYESALHDCVTVVTDVHRNNKTSPRNESELHDSMKDVIDDNHKKAIHSRTKNFESGSSICNENLTCVVFDEEGDIYLRSNRADFLVAYDRNGKFKYKIKIPNFKSTWLISVTDCPIWRLPSEEKQVEKVLMEKSIVLLVDSSTIGVFKLDLQSVDSKPELDRNEKKVNHVTSFKIIESRYADMTGQKRDDILNRTNESNPKCPQENIYAVIDDKDKTVGCESFFTNSDVKTRNRLSSRFGKIFKSRRSSGVITKNKD